MPLSEYYSGHGEEVMRKMKKKYGKRAKKVFYSTANKRKKHKGKLEGALRRANK